ncbi:MAG: SH3 domain-containing protein [Coriobacteriaceae bacterium]|nr:SH3 domain-containing protein [Coriobacteriaceae bacterium]
MSLTVGEKIAQIMEGLIKRPQHGYTQGSGRYGDDTVLNLKFSDGTPYQISGGDRDCSGAVRTCVGKALGKTMPSTFWTGNEDEVLRELGFTRYACSEEKVKRGDILLKSGHTEVVLYCAAESGIGHPICGGFRGNEHGGILGGRKGDQTGYESTSSRYYPGKWTYLYRWEKDMRKAAAKPTSKKQDTKPRPAQKPAVKVPKNSAWEVIWDKLNVRTGAGLSYHCTGTLHKGCILYLDGKTCKDHRGVIWAEYITSAGNRRWVSMRGLRQK